MGKVRRVRLPTATVFTDNTGERALMALGWMAADEVGKVAFDLNCAGGWG